MSHVAELKILLSGTPVGTLVYRNQQHWFQYLPNWLEQGFDLAPQVLSFNMEWQLAKSFIEKIEKALSTIRKRLIK
jgi:hypothetical protein